MDDDDAIDLVRGLDIVAGFASLFPAGGVVDTLVSLSPRVQAVRMQTLVSAIIDELGTNERGLVLRMKADERVRRLLREATSAAVTADTDAQLRLLAHVASRGFADDAKLDESRVIIDIIRELTVIDVRLLVLLEEAPKGGGVPTAPLLGISAGLANMINAKLVRLGLVDTGGVTFGALYPSVMISPFGREVLAMLREHGDGDPLHPLPNPADVDPSDP